jgi:acylphosphatase
MHNASMTTTVHVCVAGRVQGVGFRDALCTEAQRHGIRGWVRNCRDGRVEAVFQGEAAAVEALVAWARRGPPAARVVEVTTQPATGDLDRSYERFDWLPSA